MLRAILTGTFIAVVFSGALLAQGDKKKSEGAAKKEEDTAKGGSDFAAIEKELKQAISSGQIERANAAIDQLAATGDPKAFDSIIQIALVGASDDVEKHAGAVLLATQDPKVRAKVLDGAQFQKNAKYKSRIVLLGVVAKLAADDPAALAVLHNALKDPSKPVVLTALYWLRPLKRAESMDPLIEALEAHEKRTGERVYHDIQNTLRVIGGVDLEAPADWKNFWGARKAGAAPPKKKDGATTVVVKKKQTFFEVSLDTDRVLFLIDTSGSMTKRDAELVEPARTPGEKKRRPEDPPEGNTVVVKKPAKPEKTEKAKAAPLPPASRERLARVKAELTRVVNGLPPGTRFGILAFSHELRWWGGGKTLKDATQANKTDAVNWVRSLVADGATRTDLALEDAFSLSEIDTLYLLTDGAPQDEHEKRLDVEPIIAYAKEANRFLRCRINTISFAQIKDKRMVTFVKQLAAQNDGVCTMLP